MIKRPGCRPAARRAPRNDRYPIARMGSELSAVINRVRRAFGPLSMRESASHPEIRNAEQLVDRTARRCLRGEDDLVAWYRALRQYEECWMLQLDQRRRPAGARCAA